MGKSDKENRDLAGLKDAALNIERMLFSTAVEILRAVSQLNPNDFKKESDFINHTTLPELRHFQEATGVVASFIALKSLESRHYIDYSSSEYQIAALEGYWEEGESRTELMVSYSEAQGNPRSLRMTPQEFVERTTPQRIVLTSYYHYPVWADTPESNFMFILSPQEKDSHYAEDYIYILFTNVDDFPVGHYDYDIKHEEIKYDPKRNKRDKMRLTYDISRYGLDQSTFEESTPAAWTKLAEGIKVFSSLLLRGADKYLPSTPELPKGNIVEG